MKGFHDMSGLDFLSLILPSINEQNSLGNKE